MNGRTAAILLLATSLAPAGWVNHAGNPQRNCIAEVNGPAKPELLWQGSLNSSYGQPVLVDSGRLVTYRDNFTTSILVCHDLTTGDTLWTLDFPGTNGRTLPAGMRDGQVYVVNLLNSAPDTLYAYDAADGTLLWRCPYPVVMYLSESATFCDNGDLIVPLDGMVTARIDCRSGDTVWTTPRVWPVSGSADCTVDDSAWYCFGGALVGGLLRVYKFDLATGVKLDSAFIEDTHPGGSAPYGNIVVGPDRALYCHRCGDNVTCIEDRGDTLAIRWVFDVGESLYSPFAQLGCGPDSTIYALAGGRIVRLDHRTGVPLDSSPFIKDSTAVFAVHLAVGRDGTVYATNGGYSAGRLYAFTPELDTLWSVALPNVSTSNPAIGPGGELAIAGSGTLVRVYRDPLQVEESPRAGPLPAVRARPNPFTRTTAISLQVPAHVPGTIRIYDAIGRLVRVLAVRRLPSTVGSVSWDGRDDRGRDVGPGVFPCRVGSGTIGLTVLLTKTE